MLRLPFFCLLAFGSFAQAQRQYVVCIDPGHPSEVGPGTKGKNISEMRAVWLVAGYLQKDLESAGIKVVLTKSAEKQKVLNVDRAKTANASKADLLIRLHCDAASGSGFMTVFPDRQGTVKGVTGPSRPVIEASEVAARAFHKTAVTQLKGYLKDRGVTTDIHTAIGSKQGALTGSIFSEVPVILVEMCVLTNAQDDQFIASKKGQMLTARAMANGVLDALRALAVKR